MKIVGIGFVALCAASGLSWAEGGHEHGSRAGGRGAHVERRGERREFLRSLEITDDQRASMLSQARAVLEIAKDARAQKMRIVRDARDANRTGSNAEARARTREQMKTLRESTFRRIEPNARVVLNSLSSAQRAAIEARAKAHGRTFDEQRFLRRVGRMLMSPRVVAKLEARSRI